MTIVIIDLNHSEDNVDITEYFEESYNKDVSNIANNIESLSLKEGDSFDDFDKAEDNDDFCVFVTTLNDNHNYDLLTEAIQFEKDKQFTEEIAIKHDASQFYEQLLSKQCEDFRWFVEVMWEEETNTLINLFWMIPEQIMLWCEFNEA
ncbi:3106_t:CDS:2, partial [Cetraspora pellucida]